MRRILKLANWLLTALIMFGMFIGLQHCGPLVEARYWPAVGPLTITRAEAVDATHSRIWVRFEKLRVCAPRGVYWYRGRRGGPFDPLGFVVESGQADVPFVNRPIGIQTAGPWLLDVPITELEKGVFADAQHSCNQAWTTVSRFYR